MAFLNRFSVAGMIRLLPSLSMRAPEHWTTGMRAYREIAGTPSVIHDSAGIPFR